ncbi:hypothetical protein F5876DRAFT_77973 [Lentinula aff. lateritia]|uniref:Uncharacterized protein n=1 Tax=Lentinula aff. lateritia TaxID=2804960 RepID=A0ACC1TX47_9AGAR|nr:hypothetical protein F5876DRAFT_77973 [Lentinula aff. lateritia]
MARTLRVSQLLFRLYESRKAHSRISGHVQLYHFSSLSYGTWVLELVGHLKKQKAERAKLDISRTSLTIIESVAGNSADLEDGSAWNFTFETQGKLINLQFHRNHRELLPLCPLGWSTNADVVALEWYTNGVIIIWNASFRTTLGPSMPRMASRSRRYLQLLVLHVMDGFNSLFLGPFSHVDITDTAIDCDRNAEADWNLEDDEWSEHKISLLERGKKAKGQHTYRPDGLLEVNPKGPHPIFELMDRAEKEWNDKSRKASTSLGEAIGEYRRRYRRNPPKGFNKWHAPQIRFHYQYLNEVNYTRWEYVQKHDVQLPDEYDQIYHDLEPFWSLEPSYLLEVQAERESKLDTYTIGKNADGKLDILKTPSQEGSYAQLISIATRVLDILRDVEDDLPSFRATFTPNDVPNLMTDHAVKSTLLETARTGSLLHHNIRFSTPYGWVEDILPRSDDPDFADKTDERLLWRGTNIGVHHVEGNPYDTAFASSPSFVESHFCFRFHTYSDGQSSRPSVVLPLTEVFALQSSHRNTLVRTVNEVNGTLDFLVPPNLGYEDQLVDNPKTARRTRLNLAMMDAAFFENHRSMTSQLVAK